MISSALTKGKCLLPGPEPCALYPLSRCVFKQNVLSGSAIVTATRALCALKFLLEVGTSDLAFLVLLVPTSEIVSTVSLPLLTVFLNNVHQYSIKLSVPLRIGFTASLVAVMEGTRSKAPRSVPFETMSDTDQTAIRSQLQKQLPTLHILCRTGPGRIGFDSGWRAVWPTPDSNVSPLFISEVEVSSKQCGVAKSSLLNVTHGYQPIALLSPFSNHDVLVFDEFFEGSEKNTDYAWLNSMNATCLSLLAIPQLADNAVFPLRTKTVGAARHLPQV